MGYNSSIPGEDAVDDEVLPRLCPPLGRMEDQVMRCRAGTLLADSVAQHCEERRTRR